MLELEEAMHGVRMGFNKKFLALREVKKQVRGLTHRRVRGPMGGLEGPQ